MRERKQRSGFTLIELMIVVAIIGLLAAIAVPAFTKYIRRAKTTEATMNLRKMFDSSVAYYETDHSTRQGDSVLPQFPIAPEGSALGPGAGHNPCCSPQGDKCDPTAFPDGWDHAVWQALNFAVDDPHYFWYEYQSAGFGADAAAGGARFTARAMGNLNCNQVYSTFERVGGADPEGNVMGGGGIYKVRPLE
ncbi:pilin [Myxococcota bacterium]|nr:pilin [Myxococcota bacterium]MBU1433118.1 pilin [Myxococcota bacterium]MBU1900045.1 pilin [Myxococcota bacterium]